MGHPLPGGSDGEHRDTRRRAAATRHKERRKLVGAARLLAGEASSGAAASRLGAERRSDAWRPEVGGVSRQQSSGPGYEAKLFRIWIDVT